MGTSEWPYSAALMTASVVAAGLGQTAASCRECTLLERLSCLHVSCDL